MTHEELTPLRRDGYHGNMANENGGENLDNSNVEGQGSTLLQEGEVEEPKGILEVNEEIAKRAKEQEKLTSNALEKTATEVVNAQNAVAVLQQAEFVAAAARSLAYNIEQDATNQEAQKVGKKLKDDSNSGLLQQIEAIENAIRGANPKNVQDREKILAQKGNIAQLAKRLAKHYEEAKISNEYDDPFKQIVSFEELMTKFNITNTDPEFKPDGQFPLLKISKYFDEFGREMIVEEAHPENFLRWVQKKVEFYHDFDPMSSIDLFQGMYIVAGSRKISMYEILVDFDAYFGHRVRKSGELKVQATDLENARVNEKFVFLPDPDDPRLTKQQQDDLREEYAKEGIPEGVLGYYNNFKTNDPNNPGTKQKIRAYVSKVQEVDQTTRRDGLHRVFYLQQGVDKNGNRTPRMEVPVHAWLSSRDQWETEKNPAYEAIKEDIMYEVWLMMKNHNMDVTYRQEAMPSEAPLKEKMAQLYSDNIWTRTRDRLLRLLKSASTTKREDETGNIYSEAEIMMKDPEAYKKVQGSLGKARQRAIAFLYHISEANQPYAGYKIDGVNPAKEMLKKHGVDYSDTFYKSLMRQTLVKNLGYGEYGKEDPGKTAKETKQDCHIAVELLARLNETQVDTKKKGKDGKWDGTTRARFDWEKVDLMDLVLKSNKKFLAESNIDQQSFNKIVGDLKEKYKGDAAKLEQLMHLEEDSVGDRKKALVQLVEGKLGKGDEKPDKLGKDGQAKVGFLVETKNGNPVSAENQDPFAGLDAFAISAFVRSFNSEYTPGINPYEHIRYSLEARDRMRQALRDTLVRTEELDAFEALYAEEWAYTFTYHTGISARNDMLGIGHDAWSKIMNTEWYRLRQTGGGNYPGNLENLYGLHRLGTDFWQGFKVKVDGHAKYDKTLYDMLTGLTTTVTPEGKVLGQYNLDKNIESFEFSGNAMRQFVGDHLGHAIDLFTDITQKHEFNLDKLITRDNWGRLVIHHEEMQKMIDSTWKHLRYGFDNYGFLYDNVQQGWLYDEKLNADGSVSRTPHFGFSKLKELMFSEELRDLNMYNRPDVSSWKSGDGKMGRNVFGYLIASQLAEHTRFGEHSRMYSADEVSMIMNAFLMHAARVIQGKDGEALRLSGFFSPEEVVRILAMAHSLLWVLYFRNYSISMSGGFLFGLFEAFALMMKQVGEGIRL